MNYLVVDTETTGLPLGEFPYEGESNARIVELAYVRYSEGKRYRFQSLVRVDCPIPNVEIHCISEEESRQFGRSLRSVLKVFGRALLDCAVVVGHNVLFDMRVIASEMLRCGLNGLYWRCLRKPLVCTVSLYQEKFPVSRFRRLSVIYRKLFGEKFEDAHFAMSDVLATERLYRYLCGLGELGIHSLPGVGVGLEE